MDRAKRRQRRPVASAAIACSACRRLKMRCVGASAPPCVRCKKSGRECVVSGQPTAAPDGQRVEDAEAGVHAVISPLEWPMPSPSTLDIALSQHQGQRISRCRPSFADLPSIYSSRSALRAIGSPSDDRASQLRVSSFSVDYTPKAPDGLVHRSGPLSDQEVVYLAEFFVKRLSNIIPSIPDTEMTDIPSLLISQRPLVYCMAFVASRFVPGRKLRRRQLLPHVLQTLQMRYGISDQPDEDRWMILKALGILYTWAPPSNGDKTSEDPLVNAQLSHTELKAATETTAARVSLHRSAQEVMALTQGGAEALISSLALHKYLFWLWLFTLSHRYSLLTATPPTLREDSTIRSAPIILKGLLNDPRAKRILSEVDLCLLWNQAALRQRGLGEWWCPPLTTDAELSSTLAVLEDLDCALEIWSQRWCLERQTEAETGDRGLSHANGFITFNYHFTKFCISTYVIRLLPTVTGDELPYPMQLSTVLKSINAAATLCSVLLDLPPLETDSLRYLADTAFVKVAFGCEYILRGCEILRQASSTDVTPYVAVVTDVAHLISHLAIDDEHCARAYSNRILEKARLLAPILQRTEAIDQPSSVSPVGLASQPRGLDDSHPTHMEDGELLEKFNFDASFLESLWTQ